MNRIGKEQPEHLAPADAALLSQAVQDADMSHPEVCGQLPADVSSLVYATSQPRIINTNEDDAADMPHSQQAMQYAQILLSVLSFGSSYRRSSTGSSDVGLRPAPSGEGLASLIAGWQCEHTEDSRLYNELSRNIQDEREVRVAVLEKEVGAWTEADEVEGWQAPSRELLAAQQRLAEAKAIATHEALRAEAAIASSFVARVARMVGTEPGAVAEDYMAKVRERRTKAAKKLDALDSWRAIQEQFYGEALRKLFTEAEAGRRKGNNVRQDDVTEDFWRNHDALLAERERVLDEIAAARAEAADTCYGFGVYSQTYAAMAAGQSPTSESTPESLVG